MCVYICYLIARISEAIKFTSYFITLQIVIVTVLQEATDLEPSMPNLASFSRLLKKKKQEDKIRNTCLGVYKYHATAAVEIQHDLTFRVLGVFSFPLSKNYLITW